MENNNDWDGIDRRERPAPMRIEPTNAWWSKVTLPFILAVVVQVGGVVWWGGKITADIANLKEDFDRNADFDIQRASQMMELVQELKAEVKEERRVLLDHIRETH